MTEDTPRSSVALRIAANPNELPQVRQMLTALATQVGFGSDDVSQIVLAIDEALANVIKHGYGGQCPQPIDIHIAALGPPERQGLRVAIRDFGRQVDPAQICGRDLDDVRPGGLGVHIMRSVMDEVAYDRAEGAGMSVTMTKWVKR